MWKELIKFKTKESKLLASYIIVILIHLTFEVTLTQNHLSFGILQWFILGLGLKLCKKEQKDENNFLKCSKQYTYG